MAEPDPRDRLIVALDLPGVAEAERLVAEIGDAVNFYKIGLELTYSGGLALAERLIGEGKQVFLDLKLHDIGTTVMRATTAVAKLGATFLTVHAYPQTMKAARASGGLSEADINRMVKDAELHAAEDKQRRELIDTKNHGEAMVHSTEKSLNEFGDKVSAADKSTIEAAIAALKSALEGEDVAAIKARTNELAQASMKLGEAMYKAQSGEQAPDGEAEAKKDDVIDADFKEVGDDKKSA